MDIFILYKRYVLACVLTALVCCCALIWFLVFRHPAQGLLTVSVLNVGQGDSIYVESPSGEQVVIDGGPDDSLLHELPKVMPLFDRSLDAIMETHPHKDHIEGFIDLLKRYQVGAFIEPGVQYPNTESDALEKEVSDEHVPRYVARRGMVLDLGDGAFLYILYPDHDVSRLNQRMVHEGNVVARLVYGNVSVLLMGDAPKDVESLLVETDGTGLKSDILKVGHHGSRTSSGEKFIATVDPREAVISVGAHNMYHLPNQEPIDTLHMYGAEVLRTDQVGTVTFKSDGKAFWRAR